MSIMSTERNDGRKTLAQALYPTVGMQPDGKKIEPATVGISPKLAYSIGRGDYTPWDAAPAELEQVNWNEPPAATLTDYANVFDYPIHRPDEAEGAKKALLAMGLGVTAARAAVAFYKKAQKSRPPFTSDDARKAMEEQWGDKTDEKLAEVKAFIKDAANSYPGLRNWLSVETNLGNTPDFIKLAHRAAQRRKERGHG
jgi:hypothetical protein